jgi:diguanylate cyclase (GGDEF)-like protein
VLFIDLDNFKKVNDSLGHAVGDQLLVEVARRLQHCMRATDTAARMGGDEFTILVDNIIDPDNAIQVAERILQVFERPFVLNDRKLFKTPSIGIAFSDKARTIPTRCCATQMRPCTRPNTRGEAAIAFIKKA